MFRSPIDWKWSENASCPDNRFGHTMAADRGELGILVQVRHSSASEIAEISETAKTRCKTPLQALC